MSLLARDPTPTERTWSHADEMRSARRVQSRFLPTAAPRSVGLECAGLCLPDRSVGGDFYDVLEIAPGRTALILGDVSGKGVPAALLMATLRASLRCHYAIGSGELAARLECVHRLFLDSSASEHYATLFVGEFDAATGRLRYANCGHVPPIVLRRGLRVERLSSTAAPLGLFDAWSCGTGETVLGDADLLVAVSDGATEAAGRHGESYGDSRLLAAIQAHRESRVAALVRAVADEVRAFRGGGPPDDLTLLAARVLRRGAAR